MTGPREAILLQTANTLLEARRTRTPLTNLPEDLLPHDLSEVYFVQDTMAATFGPIGGYKVGAPTPIADPVYAPMPTAWISASGSELSGPHWRFRGLEAEIAFLVGKDLPARNLAAGEAPYTRAEAVAAMASCHPAIELLESSFVDPTQVPKFASLADLQNHGGFVYGPEFPNWQDFDFTKETVTLSIDGVIRVERTGSNPSGDFFKLLPWIANEGAARTGGLKAGQWLTLGSWTGNTLATASSVVNVHFATAGDVNLRFA